MVRTVRVRLELDRADYRQGLRDAAGDTRTFDAEVKAAGKDVSAMGVEAKTTGAEVESMGREVDTAAKKTTVLGDESDKTKKKTTGLGDESDRTRSKVVQLAKDIEAATATLKAMGEEFRKTGQIDMGKFNDTSRTLRDLEKAKKELEKLGSTGLQDGLNFGQMFSQGALKGIGRLYAEVPEVMVPLTALIAVGVGGAVMSGVLSVVGGGAIAAGVASQFNDPVVHEAVTEFGTWLSAQWHDVTSSFVAPLAAGLVHLQTDLGPALGELKGAFATLAPYVETFAMYLGIAAQKFMPGLAELIKSSGPAIGAIARDLPALAHGASTFFEQISKGSKGGVEGLDAMIQAIGGVLTVTGYLIRFLSDAYDAIIQFEDKFFGAMAKIPGLGKAFKPLADYIHHVATSFDDTAGSADGAGQAIGATKKPVSDLKTATDLLNGTLMKTSDLFDELFGKQMSADEATLKYRQGLRDLTSEINQNGRSLKEGTVVGDHNREAILQQIQAIEDVRKANIANGMSLDDANAKYGQQLDSLRTTLLQMGLNKDAVNSLIDSYKSVPPAVTVHVSDPGAEAVLDRAKQLGVSLNAIPKDIRIQVGIYELGSGTAYSYASPDRKYRWGGINYAATGLLREANVWGPGPTLYGFREPETGGEGFVPRFGDYGRSTRILDEMESWYGRVAMPVGQMPGAAPMVNVAAPSIDAGVLARAVASALQGVQVVLDGQAVGHIQGRQALLYSRGG